MIQQRFARAFLLLGLGVTASNVAEAGLVPIRNAGFEEDIAEDGGLGPLGPPPGWTTATAGTYNPISGEFLAGVPEGDNVAFSNGGSLSLSQILAAPLAAGRYTLQVEVGDRLGTPFVGYSVQLLAGGVLVAEDDNSLAISNGAFETSTVTFTALANDPGIGSALEIRLVSLGTQTLFDDVRLDFTASATGAVPEPASVATLGMGLLGLAGRGWRRRLPNRF